MCLWAQDVITIQQTCGLDNFYWLIWMPPTTLLLAWAKSLSCSACCAPSLNAITFCDFSGKFPLQHHQSQKIHRFWSQTHPEFPDNRFCNYCCSPSQNCTVSPRVCRCLFSPARELMGHSKRRQRHSLMWWHAIGGTSSCRLFYFDPYAARLQWERKQGI